MRHDMQDIVDGVLGGRFSVGRSKLDKMRARYRADLRIALICTIEQFLVAPDYWESRAKAGVR